MRREIAFALITVALTGCGKNANLPPSADERHKPATEVVLECALHGTMEQKSTRGTTSTPVQSAMYYRVNGARNSIEQYDNETGKFQGACPKERKCKTEIKNASIFLQSGWTDLKDASYLINTVYIDRISGNIRSKTELNSPMYSRSINEVQNGSFKISDLPKPKF